MAEVVEAGGSVSPRYDKKQVSETWDGIRCVAVQHSYTSSMLNACGCNVVWAAGRLTGPMVHVPVEERY